MKYRYWLAAALLLTALSGCTIPAEEQTALPEESADIAAAENDKGMMERTIDGFRGFLDCLENPQEKGVIYGIGAWKVGEIKDTPYMQEAYEMGKMV